MVTSVEPPTDAISVTIVGGDAFVRLVVQPGHEVVVLGYGGEPYLRVGADGTVEENQLSPATFYNQDRYGGDVPVGVTAEAALAQPPEWRHVGTGGTWAWHDHRAHLMSAEPLIGMEPGDQLDPQVIGLTVDGEAVAVKVVTTLQEAPSRWPVTAGVLIGFAASWFIYARFRFDRSGRPIPAIATIVSALCLIVGGMQFLSLPAETEPSVTWWMLPALALVVSVNAMFVKSTMWRGALVALAGLQLLVWAVPRRQVLTRAILPTDMPYWIDRAVTAAVLPIAVALVAVGLMTLWVSPPEPDRSLG